jgi:site-specific recombinase XerD
MMLKVEAANDFAYQYQACRTLPIPATITPIEGYPAKLKIYLTSASKYWQSRCFFRGRVHTKTTRTTNKRLAINAAKQFYESLIAEYFQKPLDQSCENKQSYRTLEFIAEQVIVREKERVNRGELSAATFKNNKARLRYLWIKHLGSRDIATITYQDIYSVSNTLTARGVSGIAVNQYQQALRLVFNFARRENLIHSIPEFPKFKKLSIPRGPFTLKEYRLLVTSSRSLAKIPAGERPTKNNQRANGIFIKTENVPREMEWLIRFMISGFMRPTDVIQIKHKHVEIIRAENIYLRLTLPETKRHTSQIITLRPAVRVYEKLRQYMQVQSMATVEDYLFLPNVKDRRSAGILLSNHFIKILNAAGLRTGQLGQSRTMYCLRHTAITFRLLYGRGIDLLTLARNARTSVQMIEKFYASQLTAEMNINLLQSRR